MTTLSQAKTRIATTFVTDWGATSVLTFDGEKFTPPADKPCVRVAIRHNVSDQESLGDVGNRKFLRTGSVFVQVFAPLDKGSKTADTLATTARNVFEGKTLSPEVIRFSGVEVREIGPSDGWYQTNVEAAFNYNETK